MNIALPQQIDRRQWLRFLQVKGEPAKDLAAQMTEAESLLLSAARPRGIYRVMNWILPKDSYVRMKLKSLYYKHRREKERE